MLCFCNLSQQVHKLLALLVGTKEYLLSDAGSNPACPLVAHFALKNTALGVFYTGSTHPL